MVSYKRSINLSSKIGYVKVYVGGGTNFSKFGSSTPATKTWGKSVAKTSVTKVSSTATAQPTYTSQTVSKLVPVGTPPIGVPPPVTPPSQIPGAPSTVPQIAQLSFKYFDYSTDVFPSAQEKNIIRPAWDNEAEVLYTSTMYTSSAQSASANSAYYLNVYAKDTINNASASIQFSLAHGMRKGSGSISQSGQTAGYTPSRAVWNQMTNHLEQTTEAFTKTGASTALNTDRDANGQLIRWAGANGSTFGFTSGVIMVLDRSKFRDGIDVNTFEMHLSSSTVDDGKLKLVIDDGEDYAQHTAGKIRKFAIRSGSLQDSTLDPLNANDQQSAFGFAYPDIGVLIFDMEGLQKSCSAHFKDTTGYNTDFLNNTEFGGTTIFFEHLRNGNYFRCNSVEQVQSNFYYCRAMNGEFNFTNNPSFTTGSGATPTLRYSGDDQMIGNPVTYITTVGLYNEYNELLAVGKVSKPLKKSFDREILIRLKLDY